MLLSPVSVRVWVWFLERRMVLLFPWMIRWVSDVFFEMVMLQLFAVMFMVVMVELSIIVWVLFSVMV